MYGCFLIYTLGAFCWAAILLTMHKMEETKIQNKFVFSYNVLLWFISMPMFALYVIYKMIKGD